MFWNIYTKWVSEEIMEFGRHFPPIRIGSNSNVYLIKCPLKAHGRDRKSRWSYRIFRKSKHFVGQINVSGNVIIHVACAHVCMFLSVAATDSYGWEQRDLRRNLKIGVRAWGPQGRRTGRRVFSFCVNVYVMVTSSHGGPLGHETGKKTQDDTKKTNRPARPPLRV